MGSSDKDTDSEAQKFLAGEWQAGSGACPVLFLPASCAYMNRIEQRFNSLRSQSRKGAIIYIGAGDPDLETTANLAIAFDRAGVDVLELGVPFSDPLADGVVNQLAAQRGLESGTTPVGVLKTVSKIRETSQIPLVLYIYFNLVHKYGVERFISDAAHAGVDGLLALDLPPEEGESYERLMQAAGLSNVYLVAPTTPEDRIRFIVGRGSGFIYYVSREGVTGMQTKVADSIEAQLALIKGLTTLPVAVGFGISTPEQARQVAAQADAVVIGSAIVDQIGKLGRSADMVTRVSDFVGNLVRAVKT